MASMTRQWIEVQIRSSLDAGEVLGLLDDPAVPGAWQEGRTIHLYWPSHRWSPDHLARLCRTLRQFAEQGAAEPEIDVRSLADQDWNRQWTQSVKPLFIGRRIVVRPSWETVVLQTHQIEIILDPKQAFGTGHHPTTSLLLEWLEADIRGGESVLDVGTGSGLLAMVALRLGAARAVGLDHDGDAIDCAQDYAVLNGFGRELTLQRGTLSPDIPYDVVLANLDRRTLLDLAQPLAAVTGERLLVSGVLLEQRDEIMRVFARSGLYPLREEEREGWLAMAFTKVQSCEGA
jgi:ribosomal protein L11 methyltransferase